jgi:putative endonuclease
VLLNIDYIKMAKAYVYILECANGMFYTGSTRNLEVRISEHQLGLGSNFTEKYLPVKLVFYEEFDRIDDAFFVEKCIINPVKFFIKY